MKKMLNLAFGYAIAALAAGVFYREFTKFANFSGRTTLAFMHPHLLVLGSIVFLLAALFAIRTDLDRQKLFRPFLWLYNLGLIWTVSMLGLRGVSQTLAIPLSKGAEAAIAGIAGIGHLLLGSGILLLFLCLRKLKTLPGKTG
ncbi:MAG: DUF2871 domain-containing protein [Spirochaetia bacterium]|nr:DUF2871 domain-containing protein [Spirochaetia bacterium]MCE1209684.1 DUF2871 domain-containing protein [Spirochaetia bacterium]